MASEYCHKISIEQELNLKYKQEKNDFNLSWPYSSQFIYNATNLFFQSCQKLSVLFKHLFFDLKGVNAFIFAVILECFNTI